MWTRGKGDGRGVTPCEVAPQERWSRYLDNVAGTKTGRRALDLDWLMESVQRPRSGQDDAERLVMIRVLCKAGQPPKEAGHQLFDLALDGSLPTPIRVSAATCWGGAKGWKRSRAIEAATETADLGVKRAFVASLKQRAQDSEVASAIEHLRTEEPELEPTLKWLAA